jgi:hypothetical protein
LLAPKGTPDAVVQRLNEALNRALGGEKVSAIIRSLGNEPAPGAPDDLAAQIRWDLSNFRRIIDEWRRSTPARCSRWCGPEVAAAAGRTPVARGIESVLFFHGSIRWPARAAS